MRLIVTHTAHTSQHAMAARAHEARPHCCLSLLSKEPLRIPA